MANKIKLTKTAVEKIEPTKGKQVIYWDAQISGFGVRVSAGGTKTYILQRRLGNEEIKITLGKHSDGHNPEKLRKEAQILVGEIEKGNDPRKPKNSKDAPTFGRMLDAYIELLEHRGKYSAKEVGNAIRRHIKEAFPRLWKKQASLITLDQCMSIVGKIVDSGKLRQADKVRSYIRTAFAEAINARGDANMPASMRNLGVTYNPAREMKKISGSTGSKDRALSVAEVEAYWKYAQELPEPKRSIAMLHILLGGQRQKQLCRATLDDVDTDAQSIKLLDTKGRGGIYSHVIPLTNRTLQLIQGLAVSGKYIISSDGGVKPSDSAYISDVVKLVSQKMEKAEELEGAPFTGGTIRATIATRLSAMPYRVSKEALGQLQSNAKGGVQNQHYIHYDYFEEKLEALRKIERMVSGESESESVVVPMRGAA
ncbi:MAG: integrase family protein [Gammaproteobacteria bacterium]|jgi:integrase|nr:integrase family protein [Gammaproteobacteria bacterium]MBT4300947.1 integrase family protein [Gammaproteobacteria bacterium]MBT7139785.1 integrase family protein [Gammaproteobacteria bacterium]